eukprot:scaffold28410_cov51-Attheya_sp.AAC.4
MDQRGAVAVEIKGGCEGGDSRGGAGDFLDSRILVYKGGGRLSETGWIIVEQIGGIWILHDMLAFLRALGWMYWWVSVDFFMD